MGTRNKLARFAYNKDCPIVLEWGKEIFENIKGKWHSDFFKNENPITLELGCGKGEYTNGLAGVFPERNHIGVDIKGCRIWTGATTALDQKLDNVAFLRTQILLIEKFFEKGEVDEIWITFPDPRPKDRDIKRRLTNPRFLKLYKNILKKDGVVNFKTDNHDLFGYTCETLEELKIKPIICTWDLYEQPELVAEHHGIQTAFEKTYLGRGTPIKYMRFQLDDFNIED